MGTKAFESLLEATKAINQGEVKYLGPRYIEDFYNRSCIYFLTNNQSENKSEVVYVGQTKSLGNRLGAHYSNQKKIFDSFSYVFINEDLLDEMEEILISIFHPKYNEKGHNWYLKKVAKNMQIKSVSHLKKGYGLSAGRLSIEKVIGILECNGNISLWLDEET